MIISKNTWLSMLTLLILPVSAGASFIHFDFEEFTGTDWVSESAYFSHGFVLDPGLPGFDDLGHYHVAYPTVSGWGAYNGSNYFVFDYFGDSNLHIYGETGQLFGVKQFDLAENTFRPPGSCSLYGSYCGVTFIGVMADGGTISMAVELDGISDGMGTLVDFETFTFDDQWSQLSMFSIVSDHPYLNPGLDNLVIKTVPEPGTLALLGLGLICIAVGRRFV